MVSWQVGIDVGGTNTDLLLVDEEGRSFRVAKVPSTPADQSDGVLKGLEAGGIPMNDLAAIIHGTTVATNSVLERKGARCGLITTRGFRDVLELGRRTRPNSYGMTGSFEALIDRELRIEVTERMDAKGRILQPLDEAEVAAAAAQLIALGAEAIVIHFLHAYANPAHERQAAQIVRATWPNDYVTVSSEIPERGSGIRAGKHGRRERLCAADHGTLLAAAFRAARTSGVSAPTPRHAGKWRDDGSALRSLASGPDCDVGSGRGRDRGCAHWGAGGFSESHRL